MRNLIFRLDNKVHIDHRFRVPSKIAFVLFWFFLVVLQFSVTYGQGYDDTNNRFMLAQNYEQAGDYTRAKYILEEIYTLQPSNLQFVLALNRVYIQLKENDKSVVLLEKTMRLIPGDINLYSLLGKTYYFQGKLSLADSLWQSFLIKNPADPVPYKIFSNTALELRDFDLSIRLLKTGKEKSGNLKAFAFDLGYLYSITMQYGQAAGEYAELVKAAPEQYFAVQSRILAYIKKPDALEATLREIIKLGYQNSSELTRLLAELYLEAGTYDKAFTLYKELDTRLKRNGEEIYTLGMRLFNDKQYNKSSEVFTFLVETYAASPSIPQWKIYYVRSLEGVVHLGSQEPANKWIPYPPLSETVKSQYGKVSELYNEIIKKYPFSEISVDARIRLGFIFATLRNFNEALKYFDIVIREFPLFPGAKSAFRGKAEVEVALGNLDAAEETLTKVLNLPGVPPTDVNNFSFQLAQIRFYRGDFTDAAELLGRVMKTNNDNRANDALELSMIINGAMKDSVELGKFAHAEYLLLSGSKQEAINAFARLNDNPKSPFLLRHTAQLRIAALLSSDEEYKVALVFIDSTLKNEKNIFADKLMYLKGNILEYGLKDPEGANSVYEEFLGKFPKSIFTEEVREKLLKLRNKSS